MTERAPATITDIWSRRRDENVINSITFHVGGKTCGTFMVDAPYESGKQLSLYVVPRAPASWRDGEAFRGHIDCLISDEPLLGAAEEKAR
jgi:hypothetical protein